MRESARAIAALCADIDEFCVASVNEQDAEVEIQNLKNLHLDAIIHVVSGKKPILKWAEAAKIPLRVGSWRRWHHVKTCSRLVYVRREHVQENEAVLNTKLLKALGIHHDFDFVQLNQMISLKPLSELSQKI